jgi:hypothetical protein
MALAVLFGRRWPVYFGGFLIGLASVILLLFLKQSFAPKFIDKQDARASLTLSSGSSLLLRYSGDPERRLVPGFQSALYLAKEQEGGRWKALRKLDYKDLLNQEIRLGPWGEMGNYEIRAVLYICKEPGSPECLRRLVIQPFRVEKAGNSEAHFVIDLDADLPDQARPIP